MTFRNGTIFFLLAVLLAARLLDVHFHLPPKGSAAAAHVVALKLLEPHRHLGEPDHGHLAGHLYEGESDEDEGPGLLAKANAGSVVWMPVLLGFFVFLLRRPAPSPLLARIDDPPPRPRRRARLAPPSQAPPLHP